VSTSGQIVETRAVPVAWCAWVLIGWAVASLSVALVLGVTAADISQREKADWTTGSLPPGGRGGTAVTDDPATSLPGAAGDKAQLPAPGSPGAAPRRPRRESVCRPRSGRPAGVVQGGLPVTGASRRVHRLHSRGLRRYPDRATPPTSRELGGRRLPSGLSGRTLSPTCCPPSLHRDRDAQSSSQGPFSGDAAPQERAARRRAAPTMVVSAGSVAAPTPRRRVRTPPPPTRSALQRLNSRRVRQALTLAALPLIALCPVLARSTSGLGMDDAIAAEMAAHPDQADDLLEALDRGRVLAGLATPVTAPAPTTSPGTAALTGSHSGSSGRAPRADTDSASSSSRAADVGAPTATSGPTSSFPRQVPADPRTPTTSSPLPEAPAPGTGQTGPTSSTPSDDADPTTARPTEPVPPPSPTEPTPTPTPTVPKPTGPPVTDPAPPSAEPTAPVTTAPPARTNDTGASGSADSPVLTERAEETPGSLVDTVRRVLTVGTGG